MRPVGRFLGLLVSTLVVVKSITAFAGPAEDASAVIDCWTRAFNANDVDALVQLYAPDGILVGTQSVAFLKGREAVRTYFSRPAKSGDKVKGDDSKLILLDANHAYTTGFYTFSAMRNGETRTSPAGFTMILRQVRQYVDDHASPFVASFFTLTGFTLIPRCRRVRVT